MSIETRKLAYRLASICLDAFAIQPNADNIFKLVDVIHPELEEDETRQNCGHGPEKIIKLENGGLICGFCGQRR